KAVVLFAVVIPLALSAVFMLAFSGVGDLELEAQAVALSVPDGDRAGEAVADVLEGLGEGGQVPVTVRRAEADEVGELVASGAAGVGVVVPEGFQDALAA